uniref:MlaD family protein n=1 Tax=Cephaloticoccus sp. TaxID=1985742 RepID=UPI0040499280
MKTKVSPGIVGVFVIGAFALGVIALLSFGSLSLFSKPQRFVVNFDETIHGLDLGSPVKIRGVRVGRVVDLNVQFDEKVRKSVVRVICEFNRNIITDGSNGLVDVTSRDVLQELIDKGLRAQLGVLGLATGLLYVELDFLDPDTYPDSHSSTEIKYATIPSVRSTISEFLSDLQRIDFIALTNEFQGLLVDTRKQVNAFELNELVAQWTKAAKSIDAIATAPELMETMANLNAAAIDLRKMLVKIDGQIDPTGEKLTATLDDTRKTLESFKAAAETLRKLMNAQQNFGEDATQAFTKLAGAADAVQRLADFIERNPQALLSGRKRPE